MAVAKLLHLFLVPLQMSTNVFAKSGVLGTLFGHGEELLSTMAGAGPGRLKFLPGLSTPGLFPRGECGQRENSVSLSQVSRAAVTSWCHLL